MYHIWDELSCFQQIHTKFCWKKRTGQLSRALESHTLHAWKFKGVRRPPTRTWPYWWAIAICQNPFILREDPSSAVAYKKGLRWGIRSIAPCQTFKMEGWFCLTIWKTIDIIQVSTYYLILIVYLFLRKTTDGP